MKKFVGQLLCYLVVVGVVAATSVYECEEGGIVPDVVNVLGCESDDVCSVKFIDVLNMTMKFKAPRYLETITANLTGKSILGNIDFDIEGDQVDACTGILNTLCPLVAQELVEYRYSAKILVIPLLPVTLAFSIVDVDTGENAICFNLDVYPNKF